MEKQKKFKIVFSKFDIFKNMHLKSFIRKILKEQFDESTVLDDVMSRVNDKELRQYMQENNWEVDELEDAREYFLEDEYGISINSSGIIDINSLNNKIRQLIGQNYIRLYHFTSSNFQDSIRENGLVQGLNKTNPHKNSYSGIYLTSRMTGPEIDGYKSIVRNKYNSDVICVSVKMLTSEIKKDLDDADLSSGETQFVSGNISPDRIIEIENTI